VSDADEIQKKLAELRARIGQTQQSIQRVRDTINPPVAKKARKATRKKKGS
jgi:hypothetical protein